MKTIIIEGTDRVGKSSLIKGICEFYEFDNVMIRHCGKPPKNLVGNDIYKYQMWCFLKEYYLAEELKKLDRGEYRYYDNKIIYNRYYPGEYVYGIMYRDYSEEFISHRLLEYEKQCIDLGSTLLITLVADPEFLVNQEDGNSFSKTVESKETEINLFKAFHEKSLIQNKLLLKVDNGVGEYLPKEQLLNTVLEFIK